MAKKYHISPELLNRLEKWQKALRFMTNVVPGPTLPLITPPEAFGPDIEKFNNPSQAILSWRDKKSQHWSFSGNLKNSKGRTYGFDLSFFDRHTQNDFIGAVPIRWFNQRSFAAHFSISDSMNSDPEKVFRFRQKGGLFSNTAGFSAHDRFLIEVDGWYVYQDPQRDGTLHLYAHFDGDSIRLDLVPQKPLEYLGQSGYLQKNDSTNLTSFYCTYSKLLVRGNILLDGKLEDVEGTAWMDHEKLSTSYEQISEKQDSIKIQFDSSNEELFLFFVQSKDNSKKIFQCGSWIDPEGKTKHLISSDLQNEVIEYWISPKTGARYPIKRKIRIEPLGLELTLKAVVNDQEIESTRTTFYSYWNGLFTVTGTRQGQAVSGTSYVKLLGYDLRPRTKVVEFLTKN